MHISQENNPLISALELSQLLEQPQVKVFDVRGKWGATAEEAFVDFTKGHIPGAFFLDWTTHFLEPDIPINLAPVASQKHAQSAFKRLGISSEDTVVLYDDYHHMLAGRIWWAMRYWGFTNIKVLNGGWKKWQDASLPTSCTDEKPSDGTYMVSEQPYLKAHLFDVENRSSDTCLVDGRGPINYAGKPEDPKTGHIPGAINCPYSSLLDRETGEFKDNISLEKLFEQMLGSYKTQPVIASCGSGYAATVVLIALSKLGVEGQLFDGSFAEWKTNNSRPIEQK